MPVNSKAPGRGSRAEYVLPNSLPHLRFIQVRIVGASKADDVTSMEILGWFVRDGRSIPITIFGVHEAKEGCFYAILNTADKTHISLDGTQYSSYAKFMESRRQAFEQSLPVEPEEPEPSPQPRASADPKPWKEVRK